MYEPVLCDFDGTLANSEPVILAAITAACAEVGVPIPEESDLRACVGPPLERIFPEVLGADVPVPELIAAYRRHYIEAAPSKTELMPGALDAIEAWIDNGIRVGIVSYKPLPVLQVVLEGIGLTPLLSVLRAPPLDEPPETKGVLLRDGLEALSPFRAQPVYIGDHQDDETAAEEVGVDFIRFPVLGSRSRESFRVRRSAQHDGNGRTVTSGRKHPRPRSAGRPHGATIAPNDDSHRDHATRTRQSM